MSPETQADLLVLGAGMAGLTAAARAVQAGASVVLVEKGSGVGGSANYAGFIWTAPTLEVLREVNPEGDPVLAETLVADFPAAVDWVRSLGVDVQEPVPVLGYGRGSLTDLANYLLTCERMVRDGGELLLEAAPEELLVDDGRVVGADLRLKSGETRTLRARTTLLATGGFGGDPVLRAEHIHPLAGDMTLRANSHSKGDGLRFGQRAGAAFGKADAGFYGHLIPSHIAYDNPYEFAKLTFYHSEHGVLINLRGERFYDETVGDHLSTLAVLEQPEARALLITDKRVHEQWMMAPYVKGVEPVDKFAEAYRRGARCAIAEDPAEFEYLPAEWGYPGDAVRASLEQFNDECASGRPEPGRRLDATPLLDPPYYVIEVIPAITFTFGGLLIDANARVLREDGTPVPGLVAAGADAGGLYWRGYAGGLAAALVFGLRAAATANDPALADRGTMSTSG